MSATRELIAALVAGGMDAVDAAGMVARAAVEMTAASTTKSTGAQRQQRYRDRNKASPTVTPVTRNEPSQIVTERNEPSQRDATPNSPLTYFLPIEEKKLSEKKESKKERVPKKRDAPLPAGWQPSAHAFVVAEQNGANVQLVEQIFRDYLKSSGKFYADYDAAFYNFLRNQRKFNGQNHGTSKANSGGSLIATIDRRLAAIEGEASSDFALPEGNIRRLSY